MIHLYSNFRKDAVEEAIDRKEEHTAMKSIPTIMSDRYSGVEFSFDCVTPAYIFRIWDRYESDVNIIVKKDSGLLKQIQTGDILNLKYFQTDGSKVTTSLKTEIKRIVENNHRYNGHCSVGLRILENQDEDLH